MTYTFLIPAVFTQIFSPIAEIIIPIGIPTKEAKSEVGTHPVTVKEVSRQYSSELYKLFYTSY